MATANLTVPIILNWKDVEGYMAQNDIVEVVRCKDCVRWNTIFDRTKAEYGLCQIRSQLEATKNDDFCSKGERRTDAQMMEGGQE